MKPVFSHSFTWKNDPISGRELAFTLGCSPTRLYDRAEECGSDRGEDIVIILDRPRACKKKRIVWDGVLTLVMEIAKELGINEKTLLSRLNIYGADCCLTYYPGKIPKCLSGSVRTGMGKNFGTNEYRSLGSNARRSPHISNVPVIGTWEARQ